MEASGRGGSNESLNLPTMLTLGRVGVVPLIAAAIYMPTWLMVSSVGQIIATVLFVAAAITDWLDGYLARKLKMTSDFGAFLDPVADKILVATCLIILVEMGRLNGAIAVIIIGREIAVSALREWMAQLGKGKVVAVATVGKLKTVMQLVGIPFLLCNITVFGINSVETGRVLMTIAAALTVWSMFYYVKAAAISMRKDSADRHPKEHGIGKRQPVAADTVLG